jgi:hypothetical protein
VGILLSNINLLYIYLVNSKNPTTKIAADEKEIGSGARNVIKSIQKCVGVKIPISIGRISLGNLLE